ncbi:hypothetical protein GCM10010206_77130 [Streptomyces cinerochromogenes]|nr:hypothetical protein GCM10010206_77130 [Streptomyces cinerochromogenes]
MAPPCPLVVLVLLFPRLQTADTQTQTSGRRVRARPSHQALRPVQLIAPRGTSPAVQLTALVLPAHTSDGFGSPEGDVLARLGGHAPQQVEDLLDQLLRCRLLAAWQPLREHDEICCACQRDAPSNATPGR